MVAEVLLDLGDQVGVVCTSLVEPEDCRHVGCTSAGDGKLDPVANRFVLGLGCTPDVALVHVVRQQNVAGSVYNLDASGRLNLEGLVVAAVFLGCLSHEANVRNRADGRWVEWTVRDNVVDGCLVDTSV